MALIPGGAILVLFWVIRHIIGFDINGFLSNLLMPLKDVLAGNSLFGGLLTVFLICFFWVLGIHGPAIMGPVIRPFWDISIAENMEVFNQPAMRMNCKHLYRTISAMVCLDWWGRNDACAGCLVFILKIKLFETIRTSFDFARYFQYQ